MCDASVRLSVIASLELIEDCVTELMRSLGIDGVTVMERYGAMWVFSKNTVRFHRRAEWLEKLNIRCYVSKHTALRIFIDTEICSETGERLVSSRIELCALDLTEQSIRTPQSVGFSPEMEHPEPMEELSFSRFGKPELEPAESVKVRSTNIDYCAHTNNIEYVRFILNSYSAGRLASDEFAAIEMHYLGQTHEGDVLQLESLLTGSRDLFRITKDGKEAAACLIEWRPAKD